MNEVIGINFDSGNRIYYFSTNKLNLKKGDNVVVETEKVDEKTKAKEDTVLRTEPEAGESIKLGNQIKIIIPEVEYKYPDFTKGYTLAKIEEFAKKHELKLEIKYQESSTLKEGTIIKQSRAANSVVTPGATLTITISIVPEADDPEAGTDDTGE